MPKLTQKKVDERNAEKEKVRKKIRKKYNRVTYKNTKAPKDLDDLAEVRKMRRYKP